MGIVNKCQELNFIANYLVKTLIPEHSENP